MENNDENVNLHTFEKFDQINKKPQDASVYSTKYRVLKTVLLVFTWIAYGLQAEICRASIEDLRIQLNTNYQGVTRLLVARYMAFVTSMCVFGLVLKRIIKYSELIMACSAIFLSIFCFLIPRIQTYWLVFSLFSIEGVFHTTLDVTGNTLVLRLWKGVSNSPIIIIFGGYSIGAGISILLIKEFIKFNSIVHQNQTDISNITNINSTTVIKQITSDDIQLQIPFSIAGIFMALIAVCCFAAYFIEMKQLNKSTNKERCNSKSIINENRAKKTGFYAFISNLLFDEVIKKEKIFILKLIQMLLTSLMSICVSSFWSIFITTQLSYLTKGPAKFSTNTATLILSSFWFLIFTGRVISTFVAYKLNPLKFFFAISLTSLSLVALSTIPALNSIQLFHYIYICLIALCFAPVLPSIMMIINYVLGKTSPVVVSIVLFGFAMGQVVGQNIAGFVLDKFKPSPNWLGYKDPTSIYAIPILSFLLYSTANVIFLIILLTYFKAKSLTKSENI